VSNGEVKNFAHDGTFQEVYQQHATIPFSGIVRHVNVASTYMV